MRKSEKKAAGAKEPKRYQTVLRGDSRAVSVRLPSAMYEVLWQRASAKMSSVSCEVRSLVAVALVNEERGA